MASSFNFSKHLLPLIEVQINYYILSFTLYQPAAELSSLLLVILHFIQLNIVNFLGPKLQFLHQTYQMLMWFIKNQAKVVLQQVMNMNMVEVIQHRHLLQRLNYLVTTATAHKELLEAITEKEDQFLYFFIISIWKRFYLSHMLQVIQLFSQEAYQYRIQ